MTPEQLRSTEAEARRVLGTAAKRSHSKFWEAGMALITVLEAEREYIAKLENGAAGLASLAEYPLTKRTLLATAAKNVRDVLRSH